VLTRRFHLERNRRNEVASPYRGEGGQAIVELALILPILVTLIFGALDVGRLFNAQIVLTQAAREGARVAAAECTLNATTCASDVTAHVHSALTGLNVASSTVTLSPGPYVSGAAVTVQVHYVISFITPYIGALIPGSPFTLTGATTMRLE